MCGTGLHRAGTVRCYLPGRAAWWGIRVTSSTRIFCGGSRVGHARCRGSRPPRRWYVAVSGRRMSTSIATCIYWIGSMTVGGRFFRGFLLTWAMTLWGFLLFGCAAPAAQHPAAQEPVEVSFRVCDHHCSSLFCDRSLGYYLLLKTCDLNYRLPEMCVIFMHMYAKYWDPLLSFCTVSGRLPEGFLYTAQRWLVSACISNAPLELKFKRFSCWKFSEILILIDIN